ncbi:MAG: M14 family zinc carboxypeptidase [Eubacteriales bacterium]
MLTPDFWRTKQTDVAEALSRVKKGEVKKLCTSAGGRDVMYVSYGEKEDFGRTANYNSACGALDTRYYANKEGKRPVVLLVGGIHAQELEGTASIMNLIRLLETGTDYQNQPYAFFTELVAQQKARLILIPICNPDGRARQPLDSMVGQTEEQMHYYGQGTWKDGSPCNWPGCKSVHPIKDAADHLGAYFNDDGVNFMHDNFFLPMAEETRALMQLVDDEAPDFTLLLHGCPHESAYFLYTEYVAPFVYEDLEKLSFAIKDACLAKGLKFRAYPYVPKKDQKAPSRFNLASAIHHICGGIAATLESGQGLGEYDGGKFNEIIQRHYIIFEQILRSCGVE